MIKQNNAPENKQDNGGNDVKSDISHNLIRSAIADYDIADNYQNSNNNVSDYEIVHNFVDGTSFTPTIILPNQQKIPKFFPVAALIILTYVYSIAIGSMICQMREAKAEFTD